MRFSYFGVNAALTAIAADHVRFILSHRGASTKAMICHLAECAPGWAVRGLQHLVDTKVASVVETPGPLRWELVN